MTALRLAGVLLFAVSAAAADPLEETPVNGFGDAKPACREWTDGCVTCRRGPDGASFCSTPGIACLPAATRCREQDAAPAKR